jgi:hypothetical protein
MKTMTVIRQELGEESMGCTGKFKLSKTEKTEIGDALNFLSREGQGNQSILHTTVMFCGECVKLCEDFSLNFGYKGLAVASLQRTVSHIVFHQGIFTK